MSVEASFDSFDRTPSPEERAKGVEAAATSTVQLRELIAEHRQRLQLAKDETVVDMSIVRHLIDTIKALEQDLENSLAFLEEFDPILFQKMKDNS